MAFAVICLSMQHCRQHSGGNITNIVLKIDLQKPRKSPALMTLQHCLNTD